MRSSRIAARGLGAVLTRPVTRRAVLGGAAAGGLATAAAVWWPRSGGTSEPHRAASSDAPAAVPLAARWLTFTGDPAREMNVSWSAGPSAGRPAGAAIRWRAAADAHQRSASVRSRRVPVRRSIPGLRAQPTYYNRAHLTGLQPGTSYTYAVTTDGRTWSPDSTFTTAPAAAAAFRFTAFGDQASHPATSVPMSRLVAALHPAFHLVAGDLAYACASGGTTAPTAEQFEPLSWDRYLTHITETAAGVPWVPVAGSHEIEPLVDDAYAGFVTRFPQAYDPAAGSPVVRSFVYGNVGVVQLDGNDVSMQERVNAGYTHGAQTRWLAGTLDRLRLHSPAVDFIVVLCNVSAYSSNATHGSDGGVRADWVPLFDRYRVDLVVSGHVHAYERSQPMRGGRPTRTVPAGGHVMPERDGTTYICCGGGGNGLYASWYGPTAGGDPAAPGEPHVMVWTLDPAGAATRVPDRTPAFSAHRRAVYSCLVVDVHPGSGRGSQARLSVRAVMPQQRAGVITSPGHTDIDSVHLIRVVS